MQITVNGKKEKISENISLEAFMDSKKIKKDAVVAELNEKIIKKSAWKKTVLKENDVLEIIVFVGGG